MKKLLFKKKKQFDKLSDRYKQLLTYKTEISRNDMEKAINNVLNLVSTDLSNQKYLEKIYGITLETLKTDNNDKLWFNTKFKLGTLYCEINEFPKLIEVVKELKKMV